MRPLAMGTASWSATFGLWSVLVCSDRLPLLFGNGRLWSVCAQLERELLGCGNKAAGSCCTRGLVTFGLLTSSFRLATTVAQLAFATASHQQKTFVHRRRDVCFNKCLQFWAFQLKHTLKPFAQALQCGKLQ